jgi:hypothetical protein
MQQSLYFQTLQFLTFDCDTASIIMAPTRPRLLLVRNNYTDISINVVNVNDIRICDESAS